RYPFTTGAGTMPGTRPVHAWMPVWRIFQLRIFHIALGSKNREVNNTAFFGSSFYYLRRAKTESCRHKSYRYQYQRKYRVLSQGHFYECFSIKHEPYLNELDIEPVP